MELEQIYFPILRHRKVLIEESHQDPHSYTTYVKTIHAEETHGSGQHLYVARIQVGELAFNHNEVALKTAAIKPGSAPVALDNLYKETPMEVDLDPSAERLIRRIQDIETKHIKKNKNQKTDVEVSSRLVPVERPVTSSSLTNPLYFVMLVLIAVFIVTNHKDSIHINKQLLSENIKSELKGRILYQDEAMSVLLKNVENLKTWEEGIRILPLIGTTGVGKTFTANIIKNHWFSKLVHEVANVNEQTNIDMDCTTDFLHLVIIDNLKGHDLHDLFNFVKRLHTSCAVLVIPIFNVHDTFDGVTYHVNTHDFKLIREKFDESNFDHDLVIYDVLEYHRIEEWLRNELHEKVADKSKHDEIVRNILNHDNVKYKGFKGLNQKLLLSVDK